MIRRYLLIVLNSKGFILDDDITLRQTYLFVRTLNEIEDEEEWVKQQLLSDIEVNGEYETLLIYVVKNTELTSSNYDDLMVQITSESLTNLLTTHKHVKDYSEIQTTIEEFKFKDKLISTLITKTPEFFYNKTLGELLSIIPDFYTEKNFIYSIYFILLLSIEKEEDILTTYTEQIEELIPFNKREASFTTLEDLLQQTEREE